MITFDSKDLRDNKLVAGLSYILFFLPLVLCKESKVGRYCANQGLLLLIVGAIFGILFGILGEIILIGWLFSLVGTLVKLALFLVALYCLYLTAYKATPVELPFVGHITLLK